MQRVDPVEFFGQHQFEESLVLSFQWLSGRAQVDLVFDYAAGALDLIGQVRLIAPGIEISEKNRPHRDLRRLTFGAVSHFQCWPMPRAGGGTRLPGLGRDSKEATPHHAQGATLARLTLKKHAAWYEAEVMLTSTSYSFRFTDLSVDQRIGHGRQIGRQQWEYHDVVTGEVFDFFRPFDDR